MPVTLCCWDTNLNTIYPRHFRRSHDLSVFNGRTNIQWWQPWWQLIITVSPFHRQDCHNSGTLPNQNISVGSWCDMCPSCTCVHQHYILLLHEEMAVTKEDSCLNIITHGNQIKGTCDTGQVSKHEKLIQLSYIMLWQLWYQLTYNTHLMTWQL